MLTPTLTWDHKPAYLADAVISGKLPDEPKFLTTRTGKNKGKTQFATTQFTFKNASGQDIPTTGMLWKWQFDQNFDKLTGKSEDKTCQLLLSPKEDNEEEFYVSLYSPQSVALTSADVFGTLSQEDIDKLVVSAAELAGEAT